MKNYREILRLKSLGYSNRSIASSLNTSRNTVSDVLEKAEKSRVAWPLDENVTNEVLDELFYGKHDSSPTPYAVINYEYIHRELSKKGITLTAVSLRQSAVQSAARCGRKSVLLAGQCPWAVSGSSGQKVRAVAHSGGEVALCDRQGGSESPCRWL